MHTTFKTISRSTAAALVAALLLAACAQPGPLPNDRVAMTPEQIRAAASDRNATVACASFEALLYGRATTVYVVLDRAVLQPGEVSISGSDCSVTIGAGAAARR